MHIGPSRLCLRVLRAACALLRSRFCPALCPSTVPIPAPCCRYHIDLKPLLEESHGASAARRVARELHDPIGKRKRLGVGHLGPHGVIALEPIGRFLA
eukprot:scaffold10829_cov129-Isochrysis_galbana.AAC.1